MTPANQSSWRGASSALLRSYVADLRSWAARLVTGYGVAVAMLTAGVLAIFGAAAVGIGALFHFIAVRYGIDLAYAAVAGCLVILGLILLLAGVTMLRRPLPSVPRPRRQARAAKQMMIGPSVLDAVTRLQEAKPGKADPMTQILAGAAATFLLGWIVASRLHSRSQQQKVRQ